MTPSASGKYSGVSLRIADLLQLRSLVNSLYADQTLTLPEFQVASDKIATEIKSLLEVLDLE